MYDIKILTLYEYEAKMYAYKLKQIDDEHKMHMQAWINHQVTATKEQGKKQVPVYKSFTDFYNYEKRIKEVEAQNKREISPQFKRMADAAKKANGRR